MSTIENLFTPSGTLAETSSARFKRSGARVFWTIVGSLAGMAALGTALAVFISWYFPRKVSPSKPPYGTCGGSSYYAFAISMGSSGSVFNTGDGMPLIGIRCDKSISEGSPGVHQQPTISVPRTNHLAKEPGLYLVKAKNYLTASSDLSTIDLDASFVPNDAFMAVSQVDYWLSEAIRAQPPLVLVVVWGDASKLLTNKGIVQKIQSLGGSYLSQNAYVAGSPYIFQYANGGSFVVEYASGTPDTSLNNTGQGSSINSNIDGAIAAIASS